MGAITILSGIRPETALDLGDVGSAEHFLPQDRQVAPEFGDLLQADLVDLLRRHVEGRVHADHLPVAVHPTRQIREPGVLGRTGHGQDLLLEEGAVALDPGKERRPDRLGEIVAETLPVLLAPRWVRLDRGLPDPEAIGRRRVDARELVDGLLDGVPGRDPSLGFPRPQIGDVVVEVPSHETGALHVLGGVLGRLEDRVVGEIHELHLRTPERIHRPFLEVAAELRQLVLDFGDQRSLRELIPRRERGFRDGLRADEHSFEALPVRGDSLRRDVLQTIVVALVPEAGGRDGGCLEMPLPEVLAQLRESR